MQPGCFPFKLTNHMAMNLKKINKTFLAGLITVLPVMATIYLSIWVMAGAENFLGLFLRFFLPHSWYVPGMGVAIGLVLIFFVGLMMKTLVVRALVQKFESLIYRVPLVKSVYGSIREFLAFLSEGKSKGPRQVVAVSIGETGLKVIGLVTKTDLSFLGQELARERIAVYIPMSYQIGGYTMLVPRSAVQPLDVPFDKTMRFVMTAGIVEKGTPADNGPEGMP